MELIIIKIFFSIAMLVGVAGAVLPVLPGAPLAWSSLLVAKIFGFSEISWWIVGLFGLLTLVGVVLDYVIPIATTKKMGGTKYGIWGLIIGFIIGIVFSPFGFVSIIIMPFLGALIGELIYDRNDRERALKSATGSIIGYVLTTGYSLLLCLTIFATYLFYDIIYLLLWN